MQFLMSLMAFSLIPRFISCHGENVDNSTYFDEILWHLESDVTDEGHMMEDFDTDGCDRKLLKHLNDKCDRNYEKATDEAKMMQDYEQRKETVCCALADFEKCTWQAYDQANCMNDKSTLRENLKAARIFLTVIENITCNELKDQCGEDHSSGVANYAGYAMVLFSVLVQVTMYKNL